MLKKNDVAAIGTNAYFLRMWRDIMDIQIEKAFFFHQEVWKRNIFIFIINDSVYEPNSKANLEKEFIEIFHQKSSSKYFFETV